ncbi:hypothetical protein LTR17_020020 [Elasticomyces elasticus]|nr:hypothetical protein LTR17_020020 [Elasticomyces elasticus]
MATIKDAFNKFEEKFRKACTIDDQTSTLAFYRRTDAASQKLLEFLEELELAPCYKLKAYLALGRLDDPWYPCEAESASRQYLEKAKRVLKDCRVVYKGVGDQKCLDSAEQAIRREWRGLRGRYWAAE